MAALQGAGVTDDRWEPDAADIERRKKELLAAARGESKNGGPSQSIGLGLQFVVTVMVCLFAGQWLDRKLGTTPWLLLAGMMLGAGLGLWSLLRIARGQEAQDRQQRQKDGTDGSR